MVNGSPGLCDQARENGSYPAQGRLYGEFLCGVWATACEALEVPADQAAWTRRLLGAALPAWAVERIGSTPERPSYVAGDGFPAEMSVNWSGGQPELRVLFDCLDDVQHGHSLISAAAQGNAREGIHRLFTPQSGRPSEAPLWHSVAWRPSSRLVHKTYFGLYDWPFAERYAAVDEAMARLGLAAAWERTRARVENAGGQREIEFFAVDLAGEADARVKIYYRNHGADLAEVNRIAATALRHDEENALAAYRTLAGARADAGEAALSCLAFRSGVDGADECTTYLRLTDLAADDQEAVDRTAALLHREGVDPARFRALAEALVPGSLEDSRGLLELVSYRASGRRGDLTTYFRLPVFESSAARLLAPVDLG
ncbi:hypothetical protein [Amycolatopsis sp. YIM 10]|uniref:hypothetical protein n=1 Tax=Amycolatopsis sp. YIM 10 TaxID=2653857 RepID=UPI0012A91231|nr:hypothetical protein [Amycolatopsis sp. YIM 10]QFU91246.1 Tryptophan dimethylallyltransferase [Amycolatopsis sp. YIM 10]